MDNQQFSASELMGKACKGIADAIGFERMIVLKRWKEAFPQNMCKDIFFYKLKNNKDGTVDIHFRVRHQSLLLLLHYEKIIIIEKLNKMIGSQFVNSVKFGCEYVQST